MNTLQLCPRLSAENFLGANKNIVVTVKEIDHYPMHWHDFYEIEFIEAGRGIHILNGKKYPLVKGSAFFIKPTDFHEIIAEDTIRIWNVTFREKALSQQSLLALVYSDERKISFFEKSKYESVQMSIKLLQNECEDQGECQRQLLEYVAHFFIDTTLENINPEKFSGIEKALFYLEQHFKEKPPLAVVAKEAGFNPTYFSELFKEATGQTYIEKLNSLRLDYACTLLRNGCSVSYACFESGFGSLSNFFTTFKK